MRKSLTFEAAQELHRRRGRSLIAASLAAFVLGLAFSISGASIWGAEHQDAAETRFEDAVATEHAEVIDVVGQYRRMLTVAQGFFSVREPTRREFESFSKSLGLSEAYPSVIALQFVERHAARVSGDVSYPITLVAPPTAAPTLLGFDLAADPGARDALETVGSDGGVTMTPPKENTYRQPRMQLVAPVHRAGRFVGWVGATLDPTLLGAQMLGEPPAGITASVQWDTNGDLLGTASGEGADPNARAIFRSTDHMMVEGSPWTVEVHATSAFDAHAGSFAWAPFFVGLVVTVVVSFILLLLGRSRMAALDLATQLGMDLAASEARAKAVMDSAVEAIVTTDGAGHIESANPAAEALFGWIETELVGRPVGDLVPSLAVDEQSSGLHDVRWDEREHLMDGVRKDSSRLPLDVSLATTVVAGAEMFTVIARDATVRKLHEDQLEHQATHDPLTGLANRKLFDELLVRAVFRAERSRHAIAVLYLDLDGFKDVNDVFGHQAGDRVLAETSRRLESVIRPGDIVARLGGDEFVVLCENLATPDDAEKIAARIVTAVGRPIPVAAGVATVSASVGIAIGSPGESAASIVARADEAMYRTKQDGKAGYRFASSIIG